MASRRGGLCSRLAVWSQSAAERDEVAAAGWADLVTADLAEAVAKAELILLCTPPASLESLAARLAPFVEKSAVLSDVASVKVGLVEQLTSIFSPGGSDARSRYVGAHPMAGSELGGLSAARADLFDGRVCLLTPLEGWTDPAAVGTVTDFWRALGARVRCLSPAAHDEAVALVSHLPHLLSAVLAGYVGGQPGSPQDCAGTGWRDMTRLAGGNPDLWTEILSLNRIPVTTALRGLLIRMGAVLEMLEADRGGDLQRFLAEAKSVRDDFLSGVFPPKDLDQG